MIVENLIQSPISSEVAEKITRKLRKNVWKVIEEFKLIEPGDKIMVCI